MTSLEEVFAQGPPWYGIRVAEGTWRYLSGLSGGDDRVALRLTHQWRDAVVEVETEAHHAIRGTKTGRRSIESCFIPLPLTT